MNRSVERLDPAGYRDHLKRLDRRSFLRAGMLGAAGMARPSLLRWEARAAEEGKAAARTKNVIILWMRGGPSQHETWDPKPEAPAEVRGPFGAIPTKVPGIRISGLLPKSAAIMDKWSIIRSLHHENAGHSAADQICFTGYAPGPNADENVAPSCGSIVARQLAGQNPKLPSYVMIPRAVPGTESSYLGPATVRSRPRPIPRTTGRSSSPTSAPPKACRSSGSRAGASSSASSTRSAARSTRAGRWRRWTSSSRRPGTS
jgi:hypothetical protein